MDYEQADSCIGVSYRSCNAGVVDAADCHVPGVIPVAETAEPGNWRKE